jgi:predicted Co/Zn/Cd cation transporter (cation efflux family)
MSLLEAAVVFVVGYVSGTVTRVFAGVAAVVALVLAALGLAAPAAFFDLADPVLRFYAGNELLFLSGFLFAIAYRSTGESPGRDG